jgi:hypothetical protein
MQKIPTELEEELVSESKQSFVVRTEKKIRQFCQHIVRQHEETIHHINSISELVYLVISSFSTDGSAG